MSKAMYTANKAIRKNRSSRKRMAITIFLIILVGWGFQLYRQLAQETETVIQNGSGTSRKYDIPSDKTIRFEEAVFTFELPDDWKKLPAEPGPYKKFSYKSNLKNADNRFLDIYMDELPLTMAVNKTVAVQASSGKLTHGTASDNCLNFTGAKTGEQKGLVVPAKWDGVDFLCDNDNTTRNVIGTSSPGSINQVQLVGPKTGTHKLFFTYTDNNYSPDYTIFYKVLDSFSLK